MACPACAVIDTLRCWQTFSIEASSAIVPHKRTSARCASHQSSQQIRPFCIASRCLLVLFQNTVRFIPKFTAYDSWNENDYEVVVFYWPSIFVFAPTHRVEF